MLEKEVAKLDGQMTLLEQQRLMIESKLRICARHNLIVSDGDIICVQIIITLIASIQDASVFNVLSDASKATEQLNKQLDIDKLEDIKEKLDEQKMDMEEKQQFFIDAGKVEDEDELMDELNELEADMLAAELESVEIGSGAIDSGKLPGIAQPAKPQAAKQSEEDELKALEMMMA